MVSVRTFSPSAKETGIAFFLKASIFFLPNSNNEFSAGSNVCLSGFICSKGLMNKMSTELLLSMRMLCTVNPAMFHYCYKGVCVWKILHLKVIFVKNNGHHGPGLPVERYPWRDDVHSSFKFSSGSLVFVVLVDPPVIANIWPCDGKILFMA